MSRHDDPSGRPRTLFLGTYIGFKELKEAGIVGKIPKLIGIQSAACAPLEEAFKRENGKHSRSRNRKPLPEALRLPSP